MARRITSLLACLAFVTFAVGCDDKKEGPRAAKERASQEAEFAQGVAAKEAAPKAGAAAPAAPNANDIQRKVIQTAHLDVLVANFDEARMQFTKLIADHKAYVSKSEFLGNVGSKRTGSWTVRVPVDTFQEFIDATTALGQPVKHSTNAEDVTEEYVDVTALVKNLKEEEEALNRLLKEKAQTLSDISLWNEKIALIRRDISKYEARLNTIGRLTAMSTAHIILRDAKDFVPVTTPSYGPTVKGTFDESLESLGRFGKWLLVVGAAAAPWTVVAIPVVLLLWVARRLSGGGKRYRPPALPRHTERREWSEPSESLGEVGPT